MLQHWHVVIKVVILHVCHSFSQIGDEYESRLEEFAALERHLVQAKLHALADDERSLASLSDACSGYQDIGLPRGEESTILHSKTGGVSFLCQLSLRWNHHKGARDIELCATEGPVSIVTFFFQTVIIIIAQLVFCLYMYAHT